MKIKEFISSSIQKLKLEWKQQNIEGKFSFIVVSIILACVCLLYVNNFIDMSELKKKHAFCFGIIESISKTEIYHYHVAFTVEETTFSSSWQRRKGVADLGDTVLVVYNPRKPSVHYVVEYNGRFVTKRMVESGVYPIDKIDLQSEPSVGTPINQ